MTKDELISFAKQLEEREKESQDFFKSESDDENVANNVMLENVEDIEIKKNENLVTDDKESEKPLEGTIENTDSNLLIEDKIDKNSSDITEIFVQKCLSENNEIINTEIDQNDSKNVCDINHVQPVKEIILDKSKKYLIDLPTNIPFLKGAPNTLIDFESDTIMRNQSGVDHLLERFIINTKSSRLIDNQKYIKLNFKNKLLINIVFHDYFRDADVTADSNKESIKETKPGAALLKLKQELSQKIAENRKIRLLQKIEEHKKNTEEDEEEEMEEEELDSEYETETKAEKEMFKDIKINEDEEIVNENDVKELEEGDDANDNDEEEDADDDDDKEENVEINSSNESEKTNSENEENGDKTNNSKADVLKKKSRIIAAFVDSDDEEKSAAIQNISNF